MSHPLSDRARQYWNRHPQAGAVNQWTSHPIVSQAVYRRMTGGSPTWWLAWLMRDYFRDRRFRRALSPGCGVGDHELALAAAGNVEHIDAFDFSPQCVRLAEQKAQSAGRNIHFYQDDLNTFQVPSGVRYDLVLCSGSMHHCRELERFLDLIHAAMTPDGYLIVNEYVGACYNLYPAQQVRILTRLLDALPAEMKADPAAQFVNGNLRQALEFDPSESVRAKLILPFLEQYFTIESRRDYGGCLLHPLFPLLNRQRMADPNDAGAAAVLRLLLEFEAMLIENQVLETDFTLCICRPKS